MRFTSLLMRRSLQIRLHSKKTLQRRSQGAAVRAATYSGKHAAPTPVVGDILAVLSTGAYNYSMASNYNRVPRLPVVMVRGGEDSLAVRRETYEDLVRNDV